MSEDSDCDKELQEARRELEQANKRLEHHTITAQDITRRNRAERIPRELQQSRSGASKSTSGRP